MKMSKTLIALIVLAGGFISSALADGWSHSQYSPGGFSENVYVPSPARVQQIFQAFNYGPPQNTVYGQVVNVGPLGSFNALAGPQQYYAGDISGGGTYYVYQAVIGSGYSVTTIVW